MKNGIFRANELRKVAAAPPPDVPPLGIGDRVILNSGSPPLLVVDCDGETVTVAWRDKGLVDERHFPRGCVRRVVAEP